MADEIIERSFPVQGRASLSLSNISGSIVIQPGEENLIQVKAVKRAGSGSLDRTAIEMSQNEEGQVRVATRFGEGILGFLMLNSPCDVDYEVRLPSPCDLQISGVSSAVEASHLQGDLNFSTVSGGLVLNSLSGAIRASTVSGDVKGHQIQGQLHFKTVSGNIHLEEVVAESAAASTVSGKIHLAGALAEGLHQWKTVSGDMQLKLAEGASCQAELHSLSGELKMLIPGAKLSKTSGSQSGEIGSGGPLLAAHSVSGNLTISGPETSLQTEAQAARPDEASEPQDPKPPDGPTPAERLAILERISNGEMTVEEGLQALSRR